MIPGANVLNMALTVIAKQTIIYYRSLGRALNNVGQEVTSYDSGVTLLGSFQPVPRNLYNQFGLDLQKSYFTFYVSANLIDLGRDVSGDQIVFNSLRYQCESNNDWYDIDGWKGVLCVLIEEQTSQPVFGFGLPLQSNGNFNYDNGDFEVGT
jgi:hypothetical protein